MREIIPVLRPKIGDTVAVSYPLPGERAVCGRFTVIDETPVHFVLTDGYRVWPNVPHRNVRVIKEA